MTEGPFMKANGLDCTDYRQREGYLELDVWNTTVEQVQGMDFSSVPMLTVQGDLFMAFENLVLTEVVVWVSEPGKLTLRLKAIDDPAYSKVRAMEDEVQQQAQAIKEHGDVLDALIQSTLGVM